MFSKRRGLKLSGAASVLLAAAILVFGDIPCVMADEKKESEAFQLTHMTVTAQKREENIQDVPMSVSIVTAMDIEDAGMHDMSDLVRFTPSVHLKESSAENVLIIRGISSFNTSIYSPAGFYVDGVNFPLHYMYNAELLDLERVEVLRGPQGTLYGRNSESGLIHLITRQPDDEFRAKIFAEYGNYNSWRYGASASGPIVPDQWYLGVAVQQKSSDGYIENIYSDNDKSAKKDQLNGRATLRWTPADRWDLALIADFLDTDDQQNSYRYRDTAYATDFHDIRHNFTDEYSRQTGDGQTLRAKYAGEAFDVISITGIRNYTHEYNTDVDGTDDLMMFNWGDSPFEYDIRHMSQELRISSPANQGPFQWLLGLYGFKEETEIDAATPAFMTAANTDIDIEGYAVFGQATYTLFEKLHLTAGLRFDNQELEGRMAASNFMGSYDLEEDLDYNEWLPKFSVAYDVNDNVMGYVSVAKGYLVGGFNYAYVPSLADEFTFDPEYTWNYEAGIKTAWLDNRLKANLSFFYIDIDDKQVLQWSLLTSGSEVENAAKAHSQGVELEVQARPMQGLDLYAGFGYVESKFDDWQALQNDMSVYDFDGNYLPNAPRYTYNLGASYRHQTGFFARVDLLGTGSFYGEPKNDLKQESYEIVNLRLGYETGNWGVAFWSKNLFDEEYVTALYDVSANGLGELVQDGEPRLIGVTLTWRF